MLNRLDIGLAVTQEPVAASPEALQINVLEGLTVRNNGRPVGLPRSKKTRALLAFLALSQRQHRRERLCELFWDRPYDPRAALRWSLCKLRPVVGSRLVADREYVRLNLDDVIVDLNELRRRFVCGHATWMPDELRQAVAALRQPLLPGLDLHSQSLFQAWLAGERDAAAALYRKLIGQLAVQEDVDAGERLNLCREWLEGDRFNSKAAAALIRVLLGLGRCEEAKDVAKGFVAALVAVGLPADSVITSLVSQTKVVTGLPAPRADLQMPTSGRARFCNAADGTRLAYAVVGNGPPLVKAANWLNHVELDWESPVWAPLFRELARDRRFICYDERGNGLSDWNVLELSFEAFVRDLETVVDALGVERFPLLGISQGCAVAVEYAVRHPRRVSHLILWGGYAAGWRINGDAALRAEREAHITLVRQGWGRPDPAYRQIFAADFLPEATAEEQTWFNDFQRRTVSAANAARYLEVFAELDVRHRLAQVYAPTLVMHARDDRRVPVAAGHALAAGIPNAEFIALESKNHLLLGREPAAAEFVEQIRQFLATR